MEAEPGRHSGVPGRMREEGALALAEFAAVHGPALRASGVPERYWGSLLHKLEHEVRGSGVRDARGHPLREGAAAPGPRWVVGELEAR